MHTLRRRSGILIILVGISLMFITEPSGGPPLSSSQIVPMLTSGDSEQEEWYRNPSVTEGALVFMEYTVTIPESDLIIPNNLTLFEQGQQDILPNIEQALTGMKKGDNKRIDLSSDEAFGPYDETKRVEVNRDLLPADAQSGMALMTEEGIPFVVLNLIGPTAELDFNHPLAGQRVVIDVRILHVEVPLDNFSEPNTELDLSLREKRSTGI